MEQRQRELLMKMEPFDELRKEIISSKEFAYSVIAFGGIRKLSLERQVEIMKEVANHEDRRILGSPAFAHQLIEIIKSSRELGFNLFISLIRKYSISHLDHIYLSDSISPLQDDEVIRLFQTLEETGKIIDIVVVLPRFCKSNLLQLIRCVRSWLAKPELNWAVQQFCLDVLPIMYCHGRSAAAAKDELKEMLVKDLTRLGIRVKSIKDATYGKGEARDFSDYIRYLLILYTVKDYDKEKISKNLSKHDVLSSFIPELRRILRDGPIEHPLLFYLHEEHEIELWDLESSIRVLQASGKTSDIRNRLLKARNNHEFHDTISEMTVLKELSTIAKYEPYPYNGIIDGRLNFRWGAVNVEVIHPTLDDILDYAGGGGIHPHSRAEKIVPKLQKIKKIKDGQRTPFLIVVNATRTPFIAEHIRNYLFGNPKFGYKINTQTQELVDSFMFRDPKERGAGLRDEDRNLLSAVLCYKREVLSSGLRYTGEFIKNEDCTNPIPKDVEELIVKQFNRFVACPSKIIKHTS